MAKAWKKRSDKDRRIAQPLTAAALAEYGELPAPPSGPFDPDGAWTQTYRLWLTGGSWDNYCGYVTIERAEPADGLFQLKVTEVRVTWRQRAAWEIAAAMKCRTDALATPQSWRLKSRVFDVKTSEEFPDAAVELTGATRPGKVALNILGRKRTLQVPGAWTCNWALFESVQRLTRKPSRSLTFTLLDEFDERKPDQRLICRGEETVNFGGAQVTATRFDQIGQGGLPCRYYVGADGRLLLAHTELRAYILDPAALETHRKKVQWMARKELR